jgi:chromosome segregation ATPase
MYHCTKSTNDKLSFYENSKRVKAEYYLSKYPDTNTERDCQTVAQRLKRLYCNQDDERIGQCHTQLAQCNERVRQLESQLQEFQQQCQTEKQLLESGKNDIQGLYDGLLQESRQNKEVRDNLQRSLEEAIAQQTSLQAELGDMKKVSEEFIKDIERLNADRNEYKKVSGEFIKDIERLNKERKMLQTDLSEVTNTRDTLINAASSNEMDRQSLNKEFQATRETIARIQLEKDNLTDEIDVLNESSKRGEIDIRSLNEQLAAIRIEMADLQAEHSGKVQELNSLREKYVQLQETSDTTAKQSGLNETRIEDLSKQFKECEEKREELVRSLESANAENGSLKLKLDGQTQTSLNVQTEWNKAASKISALNLEIAEKNIDHESLMKEHTAAQSELTSAKKERDDALLQLRNGMGERDELRENLRLKNEEVSKCRTEVESINALLDQERAQLKQVTSELDSIKFEKDDLQQKLEGMKTTNGQMQTEWTSATGKVNLLNALVKLKSDEYQKSLGELQKQVESITAELDKANSECKQKIQQCQTEKDELNTRIDSLQIELQESKAINEQLVKQNDNMKQELTTAHASCQKTIDESKNEIEQLRVAFARDFANKDSECTNAKHALEEQKNSVQILYDKLNIEFAAHTKIIEQLRHEKTVSTAQIAELRKLSNSARTEAERFLNEKSKDIEILRSRIDKYQNMTVDDQIAELKRKIQFYGQHTDATKAKLQEILDDFPKKVNATSASRAGFRT